MSWTSKSPSYQGRSSSNTFKSDSGSLRLAWNYHLGIIFPFCLTDQPTDRPTFARMEAMGGGGRGVGNLLKGKPFHVGGFKLPPSLSLQPQLRPHFVGSRSLRFWRLQTLWLGQTPSTLFNNLEHNFVVRCWTRWANELNTFDHTWEHRKIELYEDHRSERVST